MANDLETAIKTAADKIGELISNASSLTVTTLYVEIGVDGGADFTTAKPVARTQINFDGDNQTVLPLQKGADGILSVDTALFEQHQRNVTAATEYRSHVLNAVLSILRPGNR
jgi:hypothetical protein